MSKVLPALESYGAIERDGTGRILRRDRRLLVERWAQDYSFRTSQRRIGWYLSPRGLDAVFRRVPRIPAGFLVGRTGPEVAHQMVAGAGLVPVIPLTLAAYYAHDIDGLAGILDLSETAQPAGANVVLAEPRDLSDTDLLEPFGGPPAGIMSVPPAQCIVDLMTMGGRHPDLAEQVVEAINFGQG